MRAWRGGTGRVSQDNPLYYMMFKPDEWLADDYIQFEMTDRQRGWYINLLCLAWKNRGVLPNDPLKLYKRANVSDLSPTEFAQEAAPILAMFKVEGENDQEIVNPAIRALWEEQFDKHMNSKKGGERSAAARRSKNQRPGQDGTD